MADGYCWACGKHQDVRNALCGDCVNAWYDTRSRGLAQPEVILEWKPVPGWEDLYEASHRGLVRSLDRKERVLSRAGNPYWRTRRGRTLKQNVNGSGYLFVTLCRERAHVQLQVHQLILLTFAGICPPGQEARHGARGKLDNRWPENLCYGTHLDNMQDQVQHGTRPLGSARGHARLTESTVRVCRIRHAAGESQRALALEFRVSNQSMSKAITGKTWSHVA